MKQSSKLDKVLTQAEQFYARGETDKALEKLRSKNKLGLKDPFGLNLAGAIYLENGDYANAAKCLKKAVSLNPNYPEAHSNYGYVLANLGEFDEALKHCDKSIELRPNFVDAILNKGNALLGLGRSEQAIECYDKVLKFDPNNTQALASRGSALADLGEHAKAIAEFRKATSRQPNDAGLHFEFANSMREMGELERAKTLFEKGLSLEPENLKQRVNYANLLAQLERHGDAIKILQDLIKIAPDVPELQLNLVELMKGADESAGTFETYAKAYALKPEDPNIALNYANRLREAGRDEEAVGVLDKIIKNNQENVAILSSKALSFKNLGRFLEALKVCDRAIELEPDNYTCFVNKAVVQRASGFILESIETYEQALKLSPESKHIYFNIADNLSYLKRYEASKEALDRALSDLPSNDARHLQKCQILFELKRYDELKELCQRDFEEISDQVTALGNLSLIPEANTQKQAIERFEKLTARVPPTNLREFISIDFSKAQLLLNGRKHDEAWAAFEQANKITYCQRSVTNQIEHLKRQETLENARNYKGVMAAATDSDCPLSLFILGPSRSGKTTLESLIGSMDGICLGFENQIFNDLLKSKDWTSERINKISELPKEAYSQFSKSYLSEINRRYGQIAVLTNTLPGHIEDVGYILATVPNSKFVFVNRDRSDIALRIFFQNYRSGNNYAYNFQTIYPYIEWYYTLADLWLSKFPEQCLMIDYEDIIENPSKLRSDVLKFYGIESANSSCPQPYDDRGFSKPFEKIIENSSRDAIWDHLDVLNPMERDDLMGRIVNQHHSRELKSFQLESEVRFQWNNAEIAVSKKFHLVDRDRDHAMIFVEVDGQVHPRLVYQSASHGSFRVVDGVISGWYSKGLAADTMSLPVNVGEYLLRTSSTIPVRLTNAEMERLANLADDHLLLHNKKNEEMRYESGLVESRLPKIPTDDGSLLVQPQDVILKEGLAPNFDDEVREFYAETMAAGVVAVHMYRSDDRSLTYTLMRDSENKIWISDVVQNNKNLNKFGTAVTPLYFSDLILPRWERPYDIAQAYKSGRNCPRISFFKSNWNYLREIPVIRSWFAHQQMELPDQE